MLTKSSVNIEIQTHCQEISFFKRDKDKQLLNDEQHDGPHRTKQWMNAGAPIEWSVHIVHATSP